MHPILHVYVRHPILQIIIWGVKHKHAPHITKMHPILDVYVGHPILEVIIWGDKHKNVPHITKMHPILLKCTPYYMFMLVTPY